MLNKNTVEDFKECDKKSFIENAGQKICKVALSDQILKLPSLLNTFEVLSYSVGITTNLTKKWLKTWFFTKVGQKSFLSAKKS